LSIDASAQSLSFQAAVMTNDKVQKEYFPYRVALASTLGPDFLNAHAPVIERRRPCEWDGEWRDCGYVGLGGPPLTSEERTRLEAIMLNPCNDISIDGVAAIHRGTGSEAARQTHRQKKLKAIRALCRNGFLSALKVRRAEPSAFDGKTPQRPLRHRPSRL